MHGATCLAARCLHLAKLGFVIPSEITKHPVHQRSAMQVSKHAWNTPLHASSAAGNQALQARMAVRRQGSVTDELLAKQRWH
eukprot:1154279-Pelagomonas_calceolata.AAC.5